MPKADWQKRMDEVDKIHRSIIARLDASDGRDAKRQKERERQKAGLKPLGGGRVPRTQRPLQTFDEAHRANLALLERMERREKEWKQEREKRRKALRAKLRKYGLREVSSDELLASVARLRKTVDRVLAKRGNSRPGNRGTNKSRRNG